MPFNLVVGVFVKESKWLTFGSVSSTPYFVMLCGMFWFLQLSWTGGDGLQMCTVWDDALTNIS